ncbi:MAG: transporter substrate-binding domain-containing protein [Desulfuromonadales bacterium]|nr:transporter substrate-binding domain-containing protein [Desulfuromonadales bacterium]
MNNRRVISPLFWALLTLAICLVVVTSASAGPSSIRVVMDDNYPPFVFRDGSGTLRGILVDQWRLWEQKTGIRTDISAMDWEEAQRRMQAGEFDVIDTIFKTEQRLKSYDFTAPYQKIDVPIFFDKNINGISDAASLKGFVVAAKKGDAAVDILKQQGVDNLLLFNSYEAVIKVAKEHKVAVFVVDKPAALYFLYKYGILDRFRQSAPLNVGYFHRAVKKGDAELLKVVESGFGKISTDELKQIETTWYGSALHDTRPLRYFLIAAACLALLLLVLFVWNRVLRARVATRTEELKDSLETLRKNAAFVTTLVNAIPVPVFYKDGDCRYLGCNGAFEEFYGTTKEEILGKNVFDIAPRALAEEYHAKDRELLQHPGTQVYESQVKNGRGDVRDVVFHKASFADSNGQVGGLVGAILDTTELKKAETDRLNLERQLLHSQKLESLGVLAGGIAHDFNNLLHAVLGNLDLAQMKIPADAAVCKNISQAINAAKHAAKLTNMMLAYSGKGSFVIKELNLSELVEENAAMLSTAIPKSVALDLCLDHALPPVMADAGQLQQVVMNLITNASEAIGTDTGVITLSTGVKEFDQSTLDESRLEDKLPAGSYVWLEVRDSGCGMDEQTLQKLFDPFFTTKFTGRGLGMSAVLGIIRAHRGAFLVTSSPGAGTIMVVVLPLAIRTVKQDIPETLVVDDTAADCRCQRDVILVVDDEESIREVCVDMLEMLGFKTLTASSGEEALHVFREQRDGIGLVLLDQSMPGMDGVSVFQALKRIEPDIKVLLASGFSIEEVSERFDGLGLSGFIQKPFRFDCLSGEIRSLMAFRS